MPNREPNRMVPSRLLRALREAQRSGDEKRIKEAVKAIDRAVGFDPRKPK